MVMVRDGVTARVTVTGQADRYFRFLFGPGDFTSGLDGRYTISDGESEVIFAGCPGGPASTYLSGFTQYGGYFLITVPRNAFRWTSGRRRVAPRPGSRSASTVGAARTAELRAAAAKILAIVPFHPGLTGRTGSISQPRRWPRIPVS